MKRKTFGWVDPKKVPTYVTLIFLVTGVTLLCVGFGVKSYQARALAESVEVPVVVIRNDSRYERGSDKPLVDGRRRLQYRPVFQTTAPTGEIVTYEARSWKLSSPLYNVGDRLTGFYRAETGVITTEQIRKGQEFVPKIMFLMAAIFLGFALALWLVFKKQNPARE
ncbi:DUF3592 domain-containing protein [Lentibacter algarum]|uniref:DUF3592 domain-containing protein n=1 Tax=Lentibacter algarum TaxID=576131 RepID=UPI001C06BBE5|nr:DUF3592 domain-containing protein [Lentibacter algarum]MBU2980620.1 DUF3592 domain-containing protein [Lentibacter algarum]